MPWMYKIFPFLKPKTQKQVEEEARRIFHERCKRLDAEQCADELAQIIKENSEEREPKSALQFLFALEKLIYLQEGRAAIRYNQGIHPKHRVTKYHDFFIHNIRPGESVVEIGSGKGSLACAIAAEVPGVSVTAIEQSAKRVEAAKKMYSRENLEFIVGDAFKDLPEKNYDVAVISAILEHLEKRVEFLSLIRQKIKPKRLLIRVPQYDRDWRLPVKEELGINPLYPGHYIEYTKENLTEELSQGGWKIDAIDFRWGELWCACLPDRQV